MYLISGLARSWGIVCESGKHHKKLVTRKKIKVEFDLTSDTDINKGGSSQLKQEQ